MKILKMLLIPCLVCMLTLTACNCGSEHQHRYTVETVTSPTCAQKGYTTFACECGKKYKGDYTDPLGHNFVDNSCTRCGYSKHTHRYEKTVYEPTCTEQGFTRGKCIICGATYNAYFVDALGHNYVDGKCTRCGADETHEHVYQSTVIPPTCTQQGYTVYTCQCGDTYNGDFTDPLGHDYLVVGGDGRCPRCGQYTYTQGLEFAPSADGEPYYICTGIGTATDKDIIIPSHYINGMPIIAIGDKAFANTDIESVTIPDTVETIGNEAFYSCSNLHSVEIGKNVASIGNSAFRYCKRMFFTISLPDSINKIGEWAFANCPKLIEFELPKNVTTISKGMFYECGSLITVAIPDGVTSIEEKAFYSTNLSTFTTPNTLTDIGAFAFDSCSLRKLTITKSVTHIGSNAFNNCAYLEKIYYEGTKNEWEKIIKQENWDLCVGNWEYSDYQVQCSNGTIFINSKLDKPTEGLEFTLSGDRSYYILKSIGTADSTVIVIPSYYNDKPVIIGDSAFSFKRDIKTIVIPEGITNISANAFNYCSQLKTVYIPSTVTVIGVYAFYACRGINDIIYNGTLAQWKEIEQDNSLNIYNQNTGYTLHCTDGDYVWDGTYPCPF